MALKDWALEVPGRCAHLHYEATGTKRPRWVRRGETSSETLTSAHSEGILSPHELKITDQDQGCFLAEADDSLVDPLLSNEAFDRNRDQRLRKLKWNGWGFRETRFVYDPYLDSVQLASHVAPVSTLPGLRAFLREIGLNPMDSTLPQNKIRVPAARPDTNGFLEILATETQGMYWTQDASCRLFHSHGQTAQEIYTLRVGFITRCVDAVLYPSYEEHIAQIVTTAKTTNTVLIPFGGGTSVTLALLCPKNEDRFIASVDMSLLSGLLWIDKSNLTACFQAGATGKQIEAALNEENLTLGHDPDSHEFSTLGGWIATRASGMKKNRYGNIEDLAVDVTFVSAQGEVNQGRAVTRLCSGPDFRQLILGSEGTLGIIVKAVLKVKPSPKAQEFDSILFPSFDVGLEFMRDVASEQAQPASLRLIDNAQFRMGMAMKGGSGFIKSTVDKIKKNLVKKWYKLDFTSIAACTAVFEGSFHEIHIQRRRLIPIVKRHRGLLSGRSGGQMGYHLTFIIAYVRDFIMDCNWLGESFETSVPWSHVKETYHAVYETIHRECTHFRTQGAPFVTGRVSQVYDEAACLYFYFGFPCKGLENPLEVYTEIEKEARVCILKYGGSISHHHGVGKLRKHFMEASVKPEGISLLRGIKAAMDPGNIFGNQNLVDP